MPKLKTITGKKKVIHSKAFNNHILTKKSAKRKRNLGKPDEVSPADRSRIKAMLPYDF